MNTSDSIILHLRKSYLFYCVSGITYPIVAHWVFAPIGWLKNNYYKDTGAGPVHLLGGTCSFVAAVYIGPRLGRFNEHDGGHHIQPHSMLVIPKKN